MGITIYWIYDKEYYLEWLYRCSFFFGFYIVGVEVFK